MMRALATTLSLLARPFGGDGSGSVRRALVVGTGTAREIDRAVAFVEHLHPGARVRVLCDPSHRRPEAVATELPGLRGGGYGTLRRLRERPPDLVLVLWTGAPFSRPWKLLGAFGLLASRVWVMNENGDAFPLSRDHGAALLRHARWRWQLARHAGYRIPWRALPRLLVVVPPLLARAWVVRRLARTRLRRAAT